MTELIFDRTREDVLQGNEKGHYGEKDLNRVELAVEQLQGQARKLDVLLSLQTKTDWEFPNAFSGDRWPTKPQMARYLQNVMQLRDSCGVYAPLPTSMERLDWVGANQIEKALHLTWKRIESILQAYRFSGDLFAGEENIL